MKKIAGLIVLAYSCSHAAATWYGVDVDHAQCGAFGDDKVALCIAGGRQYTCIAEDTSTGCHEPRGAVQCAPSNHDDARRLLEEHRHEQKKSDDDLIIMQSTVIPASN